MKSRSMLRRWLREELDTMMRNSAGFGASGLGSGHGGRGFSDTRPVLGDVDDDDADDRDWEERIDLVRPHDAWPT